MCVRLPESFVRSIATGGVDESLCDASMFTVNKNEILKYQSDKTRTNERMMKRRKNLLRYSKSKPDDFLRAKYEHMMAQFLD